ncbi:Slp family lipoprotein [Alteromonas sp. C1M14]|uniref:Slp family lipoprotein n=1 Tax=Alteromonas sp. C1M14 TaxID=2841567 RepID=UPI001C08DD7D|nr:Slp family lipoprotein [Alteromonas sp. C1M14]MBU2979770.1 Slp family lipoprotein [Alteromonas sp. C1M14]
MIRHIAVLAFLTILSGCTIVPDDIAVPEGTNLVSYNKAVTGGDAVIGKTARWGGVIVGVENKENKTLVEVVNFPLNHYGRPNTREETIGRFKVEMEGFVDPIHFEKGHAVTFVGEVRRPIAGMVGEQPYMYPRLAGENYHLWRESSVNYVHPMFFDYRLGWYSPYYYSFYRPYYSPFMFQTGFAPRFYYPRRAVSSRSFSPAIGQPAIKRTLSRPVTSTVTPRSGGRRKNLD